MRQVNILGVICGIMAGICWGVSGVFGQFLFQNQEVNTYWLVPTRLLAAGLFMIIFLILKEPESMIRLAKNKRDLGITALTGIFGTMMFQLTFFGAVKSSNAGTATVLQYLAPIIIVVYSCIKMKRQATRAEIIALVLALSGITLISTHGDFKTLVMTPDALAWGVACAFFMFLNSVIPESLYGKYPTSVVTGYALFFGGIVLTLILRPWQYEVIWNIEMWISLFFIILGGSVAAYLFYAKSIRSIGPGKASLCSSVEPVTATLMSAFWLKTSFLPMDILGFALILSTIGILNYGTKIYS